MAKRRDQKGAMARPQDYAVLVEPVITEKTSVQQGDRMQIVFRVGLRATKTQIREAVERIFNVAVSSVNTCRYIGKLKRRRAVGVTGRTAAYKKAFVTLQPGNSIDIVEGL